MGNSNIVGEIEAARHTRALSPRVLLQPLDGNDFLPCAQCVSRTTYLMLVATACCHVRKAFFLTTCLLLWYNLCSCARTRRAKASR